METHNSTVTRPKSGILNTAEAADILRVSTRTLQRLRDNGRLKYYQDGRIIRYKYEDLLAYINEHVMEPFGAQKGGYHHG